MDVKDIVVRVQGSSCGRDDFLVRLSHSAASFNPGRCGGASYPAVKMRR
jgi:hypothetical protein